jgi:hypothetical protein
LKWISVAAAEGLESSRSGVVITRRRICRGPVQARPLTLLALRSGTRTFRERSIENGLWWSSPDSIQEVHVAKLATDYAVVTRISEFAHRLHRLNRLGDDEAIDSEFSAVCRAIWGFTLDDFTDDDLSAEDHAWLDELTRERAIDFAAEQGYDLKHYIHGGFVADWWGFTWMILAEVQARSENVVGVT